MAEQMQPALVIGGGPAGMMAAITAARLGRRVILVERNRHLGRKLRITGKGRCNLTNNCTPEEVLENTTCNSRFLYSAVSRFGPAEAMAFFENLGVPLKTERGRRVFPVSDRAADVVDALCGEIARTGVVVLQGRVSKLLRDGEKLTGVRLEDGREIFARQVVLATGGRSYPATGSTGDGYKLAEAAGHTILPAIPSLVPLEARDEDCPRLQGLALKNAAIRVEDERGRTVYEDFGELLFTHFGLSGPMILSASAHIKTFDKISYSVIIDMKPALDEGQLDKRLLREFERQRGRMLRNALDRLLPKRMIPVVIDRSGIPPETRICDVTKIQRRALLEQFKHFRVDIKGPRSIAEAIVTSGGVAVDEVQPGTMASKRLPGLFFAGEILDVDAYTGGFNLQIAWATGHTAGEALAK